VSNGSPVEFVSGHALPLDIIPITGSAYHTAQIQGGIVLADEALGAELQTSYPDVWRRVEACRDMRGGVFGVTQHDEVLPLSNVAVTWAPFPFSRVTVQERSTPVSVMTAEAVLTLRPFCTQSLERQTMPQEPLVYPFMDMYNCTYVC
jgi:hypothetical protein